MFVFVFVFVCACVCMRERVGLRLCRWGINGACERLQSRMQVFRCTDTEGFPVYLWSYMVSHVSCAQHGQPAWFSVHVCDHVCDAARQAKVGYADWTDTVTVRDSRSVVDDHAATPMASSATPHMNMNARVGEQVVHRLRA